MAPRKTEVGTRDLPLKWDVFVTPGIPAVTSALAPGTKELMWSPISSTLISGKRDYAKEMVAVTVGDINRCQVLAARRDPICQDVRLLDGDKGVDEAQRSTSSHSTHAL